VGIQVLLKSLREPVHEVHPEDPAWSQVKHVVSHSKHSLEEVKNEKGQSGMHVLL
jgi:hypothetical protein